VLQLFFSDILSWSAFSVESIEVFSDKAKQMLPLWTVCVLCTYTVQYALLSRAVIPCVIHRSCGKLLVVQ